MGKYYIESALTLKADDVHQRAVRAMVKRLEKGKGMILSANCI